MADAPRFLLVSHEKALSEEQFEKAMLSAYDADLPEGGWARFWHAFTPELRLMKDWEELLSSSNPKQRGMGVRFSRRHIMPVLRKLGFANLDIVATGLCVYAPGAPQLQHLRSADGSFAPGVVYSSHPRDAGFFIRVAEYHPYLLQDKRAEFVRLAGALGAVRIKLTDGQKQKREANAHAKVERAGQHLKGQFAEKERNEASFDLSATFEGTDVAPAIPPEMRWFSGEPLWQAMAEARMKHRAKTFKVRFSYEQDFDVSAELSGKLAIAGVSIGGHFSEFESVSQEYEVEFLSGRGDIPRAAAK
jgi:hypothetical protein